MTDFGYDLCEMIMNEMKKVYSETVIDHAMSPRNVGEMFGEDGYARVTGPCGDTMEIWLKERGSIITDASFITDGCGTTIAAGSMVTEMAKGKTVSQVMTIGQREVLSALVGLPEESQHCALLAANTLKKAAKSIID